MADETWRDVTVEKTGRGHYRAVNPRGGVIDFGSGEDNDFTPVELLLAAIAGCSAIDVDFITRKRAESVVFRAVAGGDKTRDGHGNHLVNLALTFDVTFPPGVGGDAAREVLPSAVAASHDRLCTVSRTVELGEPIDVQIT